MKILIVSATDLRGGAGIAAYRLCAGLRSFGTEAKMFVQEKSGNDDWVILHKTLFGKWGLLIRKVFDRIPWWLFYHDKNELLFSTSWVPSGRIIREINRHNPDIVHLHWVQGGMLRIEDIAKIKAPIVWTMHDMWACTGGVHYCEDCYVATTRKNVFEIFNMKRKKALYKVKQDITVIGLSKWLTHIFKTSDLCHAILTVTLPNCIDSKVFKSYNRASIRQKIGLPIGKKIILFGAMNATSDIRKGYTELLDSLQYIKHTDTELVVFGAPAGEQIAGYKTHYMGNIKSTERMVQLYNCADVMVVPSQQENLSNVIMESLSCGTPVVGFAIGGNGDMIDHKENGYLARPFDVKDLSKGIDWVLENNKTGALCKKARKKVIDNFSNEKVIPKYLELYKVIIENKNKTV